MQGNCLLQVSWELLEATFSIKNAHLLAKARVKISGVPKSLLVINPLFHVYFEELTC